jgi:TATA-binding protein-associated factor
LADIQKQHPHELYNLLARVAPYLRNREWECRVAAGKAIGGIAEHVPPWDPNKDEMQEVKAESSLESIKEEPDLTVEPGSGTAKLSSGEGDGRLSFNTFDPVQVLKNGEKLLGSQGKVLSQLCKTHSQEYDVAREFDLSTAEGIAKQKQLVNKRLGLGSEVFDRSGMIFKANHAADLVDIDDLTATAVESPTEVKGRGLAESKKNSNPSHSAGDFDIKPTNSESQSEQGSITPTEGMSARQLNVLKRKAKASKFAAAQKYGSPLA